MFSFVWSVILNTSQALSSTSESSMSLLLATFVLENSRVYIHTLNSGNIASYVKAPVNQIFSIVTTLNILYI